MLLAALAAAPAAGQRSTRPTSVYTPLDLDRCTVLSRVEEGESVAWRCPGFAGVPLFVLSGDGRFDLDAGIDNEMWESPEQFSGLPARVEWRLRGGRPFAVIYRLTLTREGGRAGTVLIVETVGRRGSPGCHIATVEGRVANANAEARSIADDEASDFRCGEDEALYVMYVAG